MCFISVSAPTDYLVQGIRMMCYLLFLGLIGLGKIIDNIGCRVGEYFCLCMCFLFLFQANSNVSEINKILLETRIIQ